MRALGKKIAVLCVAGLAFTYPTSRASAAILNYTVSYDGTTTAVANSPDSEFILTLMPLVGDDAGKWFGIDPGNSVTVDPFPPGKFSSTNVVSGTYSALPGCPGGGHVIKDKVVLVTVEAVSVVKVVLLDKRYFVLLPGQFLEFTADGYRLVYDIDGEAEVRVLHNDGQVSIISTTTLLDKPPKIILNISDIPQLFVDNGWEDSVFVNLVYGSVYVENETHMYRIPVFTDTLAVGVPEPATLSLLALGACLPLLRRRR
jgi:hypothetical protein